MFGYGGKEKNFRLVPAVIFLYDCSRLYFLILMLPFFTFGQGFESVKFPFLAYFSPNVLFPLMSFFLLIRFEASKAFIPLYITGKSLSLLCMIIWILFALRGVSDFSMLFWSFSLCAADLGTIMGFATAAEPTAAEPTAAEPTAARPTAETTEETEMKKTAEAKEGGE